MWEGDREDQCPEEDEDHGVVGHGEPASRVGREGGGEESFGEGGDGESYGESEEVEVFPLGARESEPGLGFEERWVFEEEGCGSEEASQACGDEEQGRQEMGR